MKKFVLSCLVVVMAGCGSGGSESSPCSALKVAGGESCDSGEPKVALLAISEGGMEYTCTGTYISQTAVLTARHCVDGRPASVLVVSSGHLTDASQVILHPYLDLAIVKVSNPIQVAPVSVSLFDYAPTIGEELVAYGYGMDETGAGVLERIQNSEAPLKATSLSFAGSAAGGLYVTASNGSGNTCKGDSGGPVLAKNSAGQYGLIAVTSFSPNVSFTQPCIPIEAGYLAYDVSLQNAAAADFILNTVPDVSVQ
jgi:hypothetical protein